MEYIKILKKIIAKEVASCKICKKRFQYGAHSITLTLWLYAEKIHVCSKLNNER